MRADSIAPVSRLLGNGLLLVLFVCSTFHPPSDKTDKIGLATSSAQIILAVRLKVVIFVSEVLAVGGMLFDVATEGHAMQHAVVDQV